MTSILYVLFAIENMRPNVALKLILSHHITIKIRQLIMQAVAIQAMQSNVLNVKNFFKAETTLCNITLVLTIKKLM